MASFYDEEEDSFEPDRIEARDSFSRDPDQSSSPRSIARNVPQQSTSFDDSDEDSWIDVQTTVPSFIDSYNKSKMSKIKTLETSGAKRPLFMVDGQYTTKLPEENLGLYRPLGGPAQYIGKQYSHTPVQFEEAKKLRSDLIPTNDLQIHAKRGEIFQSILQGANGDLTPETFNNNPYWKNLEEQGMGEDAINAVKRSVLHAIKPEIQKYNRINKATKALGSVLGDEATGDMVGMFLEKNMPSKPSHDFFGSNQWYSILNAQKDKADLLFQEPRLAKAFGEMEKSEDEDDRMDFIAAINSKSASRMGQIIGDYNNRQEKKAVRRDKNSTTIDLELGKVPGKLGKETRDVLIALNKQGYFDGKESLIDNIARGLKDTTGDFELPDSGKFTEDGQNLKLFGLKTLEQERKVKEEIEKSGVPANEVVIGTDGKVYSGSKLDTLINQDIKHRFGNTKIKTSTPGEYVELDREKFNDFQGNTVFVKGSYEYNGKMFVPREAVNKLKAIGSFDDDELKDEGPIPLPKSARDFLSYEAQEYKPLYLTGDQFMDQAISDGNRFSANKFFHEEMLKREENIKRIYKKDLLWAKEHDDPTFIGETTKAVTKSIAKAGAEVGLGSVGAVKSTAYLIAGILSAATGNKESAEKFFLESWGETDLGGEVKPSGEIVLPGIGEEIETQINEGGFWNLDKLNENPEATGFQKVGAFGGHLAGDLVGMSAQLAMMGPLGAEAASVKLGANLNKILGYEKAIAGAMKQSGKAAEIANLYKKQAIVAQMVRAPVEFTALAALEGRLTPTDIAQSGAEGLLAGAAQVAGRGLRLPFVGKLDATKVEGLETGAYKVTKGSTAMDPWYPDWKRIGAGGMAALGIGGIDTLRKKFDGKSWEEIQAMWKDPEQAANIIAFGLFPIFGQKKFEGKEFKGEMKGPHELIGPNAPNMAQSRELILNRKGKETIVPPRGLPMKTAEPVKLTNEPKKLNILKLPTFEKGVPKVETQFVEPRSPIEVQRATDRYMELASKETRTKDEDVELSGLTQFLTEDKSLDVWTKEALAMRAGWLAKEMNEGRARPEHFAEFSEIMKRIKDPEPGKDIPFRDVVEMEKVDGPALVKAAEETVVEPKAKTEAEEFETVKAEESHIPERTPPPEAVEALRYANQVEKKYKGLAADYRSKKEIWEKQGFGIIEAKETKPGQFHIRAWLPQSHETINIKVSATNSSEARSIASDLLKEKIKNQRESYQEETSAYEEAFTPEFGNEHDLEVMSKVVTDGVNAGKSTKDIVNELTSEKYGFDEDEAVAYIKDFKSKQNQSRAGEMDRLKKLGDNLGCDLS